MSLGVAGIFLILFASHTIAQQPSSSGTPEASFPDADTLIARYVEAIGGVEVLKGHRSFSLVGDIEVPQLNFEGEVTVSSAAPNKFYSNYSVPGFSSRSEGYDGKVGWRIEEGVYPRIVEGRELEDMLLLADFDAELNYKINYKSRETVGREEFAGVDCWKVQLFTNYQEESIQYFDARSGLLLGKKSWVGASEDAVEVTEIFSEYREVDGHRIAMLIRQQFTGIEQIITLIDVQFNQVEDGTFDLPETVANLLQETAPKSGH